jgi:hypothetical protein
MAKTAKISQKKWIHGVNAAASDFAQPPGSFPRDSNVIYVPRGSLATCDGSQLISELNGVIHPGIDNIGPITELFLYQPNNAAANYFLIEKDYTTHLAIPSGVTAVDGGAGSLTNGTYQFVVTAIDGIGGETPPSAIASVAIALNHKITISWSAVSGAAGYIVYYAPFALFGNLTPFPVTTTSFSFSNISQYTPTQNPPTGNNTQTSPFYLVPPTSYGAANLIFTFPADNLPFNGGTEGGYGGGVPIGGGGGPAPTSGSQPPTPAGGIVGNLSPIPLILQFKNLMILLLGNGISPYSSDGTTPNTIPLTNTFQASYGSRAASTVQNVGDQIAVNIAGTNYIFTASQAGTTGAGGPPAFSATLGSIVVDGTVYWKNTGAIAAVTAPRGAAHGIVYAGSLWVGNTSPTTTTDNFDGPSCLKMSDLNNPNSWNPLNVAFLDRDDGTQITGMATFTIAESGIPPSGSLVVFKDFSTFQINGVFGASNFSIQRAQTDLGCVSPRTIQFVPGFGIVRMTHLGIAMFDGVRDRLISEEVRPYIFGGEPDIAALDWNYVYFCKAAQVSVPPMYCCAIPLVVTIKSTIPGLAVVSAAGNLPLTNYFIRAIAVQTNGSFVQTNEVGPVNGNGLAVTLPATAGAFWRIYFGTTAGQENQYVIAPITTTSITINNLGQPGIVGSSAGQLTRMLCYDLVLKAWTIIDLPFPISAFHQFRTPGSIPISVMGGFSDGAIRRWLGGAGLDTAWDAGAAVTAVQASVRTPQVFGKDASDRVYFRQLALRGEGTPVGLTTVTTVNGVQGVQLATRNLTVSPMGGGEFVAYAELGITGMDAYADIKWTGPLEIDSVDWLAIAKAIRGRVTV